MQAYSDGSDSECGLLIEKGQGFSDINQILGEYLFDRKELGKQPLLCYMRLPRQSHDISLKVGGKLLHNIIDFEDLRKTFFTMRRSELCNLEDALKRQYREHNFGWPGESRQLKFSSLFEGGNLQSAIRSFKHPNTYFLEMIPDSNSVGDGKGHFHFKVENAQKGVTYTFVIANYDEQNRLLHNRKACVLSLKEQRKSKKGWLRADKPGVFFSNCDHSEVPTAKQETFDEQLSEKYSDTHSYSFSYECRHEHDHIEFSSSFPYSSGQLQTDMKQLVAALSPQDNM